jgi:DNA-binding NarL/FixJ family response regulator
VVGSIECKLRGGIVQQPDKVAVLVDDMFFAAKINGAAQSAGREVVRLRSREQLDGDIISTPPSLVIVDLNSDRVNPFEAIERLKSHAELKAVPVVAFVSHVQTDLIRRAQEAGCDYVLPRSAFTQMLNQIVAGDFSSLQKR